MYSVNLFHFHESTDKLSIDYHDGTVPYVIIILKMNVLIFTRLMSNPLMEPF